MAGSSSILDDTVDAEPTNNFADRLGPGSHEVALVSLEIKQVFDKKLSEKIWLVGSEWFVRASTAHKRGERRSIAWKIGKPGNGGKNERSRMNEASRALTEALGAKCGEGPEAVAAFKKKVRENLDKMLEVDPNTGCTRTNGRQFRGRGIVLRIESTSRAGTGNDGKDFNFTNHAYTPIPQTAEDIKAARAMIEATPAPASTPKTEAKVEPKVETKQTPAPSEPDMLDGII